MNFVDINTHELDNMQQALTQIQLYKTCANILGTTVSELIGESSYVSVMLHDDIMEYVGYDLIYCKDESILSVLMNYIFGEDVFVLNVVSREELAVLPRDFADNIFTTIAIECLNYEDVKDYVGDFVDECTVCEITIDEMIDLIGKADKDIHSLNQHEFDIFCEFVEFISNSYSGINFALVSISIKRSNNYDTKKIAQLIGEVLNCGYEELGNSERIINIERSDSYDEFLYPVGSMYDLMYTLFTPNYHDIVLFCQHIAEIGVENIEK